MEKKIASNIFILFILYTVVIIKMYVLINEFRLI